MTNVCAAITPIHPHSCSVHHSTCRSLVGRIHTHTYTPVSSCLKCDWHLYGWFVSVCPSCHLVLQEWDVPMTNCPWWWSSVLVWRNMYYVYFYLPEYYGMVRQSTPLHNNPSTTYPSPIQGILLLSIIIIRSKIIHGRGNNENEYY